MELFRYYINLVRDKPRLSRTQSCLQFRQYYRRASPCDKFQIEGRSGVDLRIDYLHGVRVGLVVGTRPVAENARFVACALLEKIERQAQAAALGIGDLNLLLEIYPKLSENLRIAQLCKGVGLAVGTIKQLFTGEAVLFTGKLHSPEYEQDFNVQEAKLQIFKEQDNSDRFRLSLNGQNTLDWFRQKYQEVKQTIRPHTKPILPQPKKGRGV